MQELVDEVITYILENKQYGDIIEFDEVNTMIKEDLQTEKGSKRFKKIMQKVKENLYEKGYVIKAVVNVGYYILKPNQVSSYTYRTFIVKPMKKYQTAATILNNLNKKELSDDKKEEYKLTTSLNNSLITATDEIMNIEKYKELEK